MKKRIRIFSICLIMLCSMFLVCGCGKNEIESKWITTGGWSKVYVYEGEGEFISMLWQGNTGTASFSDTDPKYTKKYVEKYQKDSNYKTTTSGLQDSYKGNVASFETKDKKLWIRIMWTNTATFLLVKTY